MRCDFHCHTRHSYDSLLSPRTLVRTALRRGLEAVAVTDHGAFAGAEEAVAEAAGLPLIVVPGVEVATAAGDIVGLFLTAPVKARRVLDVLDAIRSQGGIAVLPHPFHHHDLAGGLPEQVDAIEVFNARCTREQNQRARELAARLGKPGLFGSDAHLRWEVGRGYCEVQAEPTLDGLRRGVLAGATRVAGAYSPFVATLLSQGVKWLRRLRRRPEAR